MLLYMKNARNVNAIDALDLLCMCTILMLYIVCYHLILLLVQVTSDHTRMVRMTACECLKELEMKYPVSNCF